MESSSEWMAMLERIHDSDMGVTGFNHERCFAWSIQPINHAITCICDKTFDVLESILVAKN